MATATTELTKSTETRESAKDKQIALRPSRLAYHPSIGERYNIEPECWKALVEAIFPNAQSTESVILALSYCKARNLDPFKRNIHIVPIWNNETRQYIDTVWPGIGELRTTAFRTECYAGRGETVVGPTLNQLVGKVTMTFPEWAQVTVKRIVKGMVVEFCGPKVYWIETYAVKSHSDDSPNSMWESRPRGQLEKCAEAAALRAAFPEEIGNEYTNDEVGRRKAVVGEVVEPTASLQALTEKLTAPKETASEEAVTSPVPSETKATAPAVTFADFLEKLSKATTLAETSVVYEAFFGPEAPREWTPDECKEAMSVVETKRNNIRAAKSELAAAKEAAK